MGLNNIRLNSQDGFTLTELMVAMVIGLIVISGVYSTYYSQQRTYSVQTQVAFMNQNLRSGMYFMEREIRMAGYDPTGNANAGIVTASSNSITFSMDLNGDGDTNDSNELITYSLYDAYSDGDTDLGRRSQGGPNQPVAENIDALNFVYLDENGNVTFYGPSTFLTGEIEKIIQTGFQMNLSFKTNLMDI